MELYFRKSSIATRKAMCEAVMQIDHAFHRGFNEIRLAQDRISEITGHEYVKVVNSGNSAILAAMNSFKGKILIPDQGGWSGFKNLAEYRGLEVIEVPTTLGVINPDVVEDIIVKHKPEALFITSFAGYIAEQPVKELFELCNYYNVILVEDASGGIGDNEGKLCYGNHAHMIVASTGSPKIVNVGNGGFISTGDNEFFKKSTYILKTLKADPITCVGIFNEVNNASSISSKSVEACNFIKGEFKSSIHADKRGVSVALMVDEPKRVGYLLRQKLNVEGRSIVTVCPRYNRVLVDAVCIEIKNLDVQCMENDTLTEIIDIIKEVSGDI
jgi:hypothetical protein